MTPLALGIVLACSHAETARAAMAASPSGEALAVTGSLTFTWHGDPARECARRGTCGVSGALIVEPDGSGYVTQSNAGVCGLLDACGLRGSLALALKPHNASGSLTAFGPARLPYRDFLVALGLRPGVAPKSINVDGSVDWDDAGSVSERLTGPVACSDAVSLGGGGVSLIVAAGRITAQYGPASALRTRCPGPAVPDPEAILSGGGQLETDGRSLTLTLDRGRAFEDDGYLGRIQGRVTLTLRRGRLRQQIFSEPQ